MVPQSVFKEHCNTVYGRGSSWAPPLGVAIRWGSHYRVLEWLRRRTTAIDLSLRDDRVHHATNYADVKRDFYKIQGSAEDRLKLAIECLRPIVFATHHFESDAPTLSSVVPL